MRLNDPHHLQIQDLDALEANELAMAFIQEQLIEPMQENNLLDKDAFSLLNVVGGALQAIAHKAHSYETLYENKTNANYFRN
jgi:hypothetical protein